MSLFGFGKEKALEQAGTLVLAYLEDALRVKSPFLLKSGKNGPSATLHSVNEDAGTFRLSPGGPLAAGKGELLEFILIHDGLRMGGTAPVVESRPGVLVLQLPEALVLKERRRSSRARFNLKEGATLNAFQDLFEGVGISGSLENVSESGFRVWVEKAISISTEKSLILGTTLVPPGQIFKVIRLTKIPKCPALIETVGKAVYLAFTEEGLVMGFTFDKLSAEAAGALQGLITSRTSPIPNALPFKARRPKKEVPTVSENSEVETPLNPAPGPKVQEAPPSSEAHPVPDRHAALLRLKKMSRTLVIYSPASAIGLLRRFLTEHGFGRIQVTLTLESLLDELRRPNLGALFIDWDGSTEEAIELMKLLTHAFEDLPPVVLAARQVTESLVVQAGEAGMAHLMVKPYACDEALAALFDEQFSRHAEPVKG